MLDLFENILLNGARNDLFLVVSATGIRNLLFMPYFPVPIEDQPHWYYIIFWFFRLKFDGIKSTIFRLFYLDVIKSLSD